MKDKLDSVDRVLKHLWPELREFDWNQYGTSLQREDADGRPKYPGLVFRCGSAGGNMLYNKTYGEPVDLEIAEATADRKIFLVLNQMSSLASMESRDPEAGDWGGGIRVSTDRFKACALSGQPEIVDHVLLARVMHEPRLLTLSQYRTVTDHRSLRGLSSAMKRAGMTETQFLQLVRDLSSLVEKFAHG